MSRDESHEKVSQNSIHPKMTEFCFQEMQIFRLIPKDKFKSWQTLFFKKMLDDGIDDYALSLY